MIVIEGGGRTDVADVSGQGRVHENGVEGGCALDGRDHLSRHEDGRGSD